MGSSTVSHVTTSSEVQLASDEYVAERAQLRILDTDADETAMKLCADPDPALWGVPGSPRPLPIHGAGDVEGSNATGAGADEKLVLTEEEYSQLALKVSVYISLRVCYFLTAKQTTLYAIFQLPNLKSNCSRFVKCSCGVRGGRELSCAEGSLG